MAQKPATTRILSGIGGFGGDVPRQEKRLPIVTQRREQARPTGPSTLTGIAQALEALRDAAQVTAQFVAEVTDDGHRVEWQAAGSNAARLDFDPASLVGQPGEMPTETLARYIGDNQTEGFPDVYTQAFSRVAAAKYDQHLRQVQVKAERTQIANVASALVNEMTIMRFAGGEARYEQVKKVGKERGLSDAQIIAPVFQAAQVNIVKGDVPKAEKFAALLRKEGFPDLAVGLVQKTKNSLQAQSYKIAGPLYEADIRVGRPLSEVIDDIDKRTGPDKEFNDRDSIALKNRSQRAARDRFNDIFWGNVLNDVGTPASQEKDIRKAEEEDVLTPEEAVRQIGNLREAGAFDSIKKTLHSTLQSDAVTLPIGIGMQAPALGLASDLQLIRVIYTNDNHTQMTYHGVEPTARAEWAEAQKKFGTPLPKVAKYLAETIGHTDELVVQEGIAEYFYLNSTAPEIAASMLKRFGKLGRARVRSMTRQLEDASVFKNNPGEVAKFINQAMPGVMRTKIVDESNAQARARLFSADNDPDVAVPFGEAVVLAGTIIEDGLPAAFKERGGWWTSDRKVDLPNTPMKNNYVRERTAEYLALVGVGVPSPTAVIQSDIFATNDTINKGGPVIWRAKMNQIVWSNNDTSATATTKPFTTPDTGPAIVRSLKEAGVTGKELVRVLNTYDPVFIDDTHGWMLLSIVEDLGEPYIVMRDGRPVQFTSHARPKTPGRKGQPKKEPVPNVPARPESVQDWSLSGQQRMAQEILGRIRSGEPANAVLSDAKYAGTWDSDIYNELGKALPPVDRTKEARK